MATIAASRLGTFARGCFTFGFSEQVIENLL